MRFFINNIHEDTFMNISKIIKMRNQNYIYYGINLLNDFV